MSDCGSDPIVEFANVTKKYPGHLAVNDVILPCRRGK
jgi:ABC-type sugar transport system ATPase subunit